MGASQNMVSRAHDVPGGMALTTVFAPFTRSEENADIAFKLTEMPYSEACPLQIIHVTYCGSCEWCFKGTHAAGRSISPAFKGELQDLAPPRHSASSARS